MLVGRNFRFSGQAVRWVATWPFFYVFWQPALAGAQLPSLSPGANDGVSTAAPQGVPTVLAMTFPEALAYARAHQPALRAARERFIAVAADSRIPGSQWLPSVGAGAEVVGATTNNSTATPLGTDAVDLPRIGGTAIRSRQSLQPYATTLAAVGLRQELFDFGRIAAETAAAEALVAIERDRLQGTQLDTTLIVSQAYYAVAAAKAVMLAATQAEQRAQVHRDFAAAAVKAGLRSPIELTRALADFTRFTVGRIRAEGNVRIARNVFAASVGFTEPELDVTESAEARAPLPTLATVEARAEAQQPELLQAIDQHKAQQSATTAIAASTRPNLFASASISARAGGAAANTGFVPTGDGFLPVFPNYDVGVVLSWPFYEPTVNARVDASRQRESAFHAQIAAVRQRTIADAQRAYRRARVADTALVALVQAADAARANYGQADARFRSGMGTSTELADAEAIRLDAEVQLAIGGFDAATARANLARVMGD
jgi:outer membrane protein